MQTRVEDWKKLVTWSPLSKKRGAGQAVNRALDSRANLAVVTAAVVVVTVASSSSASRGTRGTINLVIFTVVIDVVVGIIIRVA